MKGNNKIEEKGVRYGRFILLFLLLCPILLSAQSRRFTAEELRSLAEQEPEELSCVYRAYRTPEEHYAAVPTG